MKAQYIFLAAAALVACAACTRIVEQPEAEGVRMTYRAYQEGAQDTKTTAQDGGTLVYWEPADEIKVFFKSFTGRFVSQNSEPVGVADFSGTLSVLVGANEGFEAANQTWGLYPYRSDAAFDGESVTTTLPAAQTGKAGSFARNTHICLARSGGLDLAFYNVTGGLRFSLTREGISSVTFEGNNNEAIAGKIKICFEDGVPAVKEVKEGETAVTLTAPEGETFQTGQWYYIEALPGTLSKGFKMVFTKGDETATLSSDASVTIHRGKYGSLADADEGLVFKDAGSGSTGGTIGEPVDLGLSVKWSSWNVGASKPEESGDYFAWGETEPKDDYSWDTYKWGKEKALTKYCPSDKTDYWAGPGSPDGKTVLDLEDDAARVNWGDGWRMPVNEEWEELMTNCTWNWTNNYNGTGIAGQIITSKKDGYTGKSIFLPASGDRSGIGFDYVGAVGYYWSPVLSSGAPNAACFAGLYSGGSTVYFDERYYGFPIRPVYGDRVQISSVTLDRTSVEILPGKTVQLTATVLPDKTTVKTVTWTSGNTSVASVSKEGLVTAHQEGSAVITVTVATQDEELTATCTVTVKSSIGEAVDLGLSVKWASFNVGASKPEEYGDYFAWGETEPKDDYSWDTYKWCNGTAEKLTKYCPSDKTDYWAGSGSPDGKTVLDLEDDAARVNWGEDWRMPTNAELEELINNCIWTWTDNYNGTGISGQTITSKKAGYEDRSIFLPAAGFRYVAGLSDVGSGGDYWSSSLNTGNQYCAWRVLFGSGNVFGFHINRYCGLSVRPVYGDRIHVTSVSLDRTSLTIISGKTVQLTATVSPDDATDKTVFWTSSNPSVASVNEAGLVTSNQEGTAIITVTTQDGALTATCTVEVKSTLGEAVDLGLSVKWASYNVGASKPEEYGDYFAWGETESKSDYSWETYKWCNGSSTSLTKYCSSDGKTVLDLEDDAASVNWGDNWRMPTNTELEELIDNCTWTWANDYNGCGVNGYIVTSTKNGYTDNSIFLPGAGFKNGKYFSYYGCYWTSSIYTNRQGSAWSTNFKNGAIYKDGYARQQGFTVRPVYGERVVHASSVTLDRTSLTIIPGRTIQLTATVSPDDATDKTVSWASSNSSVASVNEAGEVTAHRAGTAIITVTTNDGALTATCTVEVKSSFGEAVDLGLSVKWASYNVGAAKPEEYGDYFAWGETEPKSDYSITTYKWCNGSETSFTKYCLSDKTDYWAGTGSPDEKTVLDLEDDAARVNWGEDWRMPTGAEWEELINNCIWTWSSNYNGSGIAGYIVTSKKAGYTERFIFLPAAGDRYGKDLLFNVGSMGFYWSSSLWTDYPSYSRCVYFRSATSGSSISWDFSSRYGGLSIRPVYGNSVVNVSSVKLDESLVIIIPGSTIQLTASVYPDDATDKTVSWASSNPSVASVNEAGVVKSHQVGTAIITVTTNDGKFTTDCTVEVKVGEAVDLGLSVKWSSCNVGAAKPEDRGFHFAWGETEPKSNYSWSTYKWGKEKALTKYCLSDKNDDWAGTGSPDGKSVLDLEDDAARVNWGDGWRMPTDAEWEELINNCTWTWSSNYNGSGTDGYIVAGKKTGYTNQSIFLPVTGAEPLEFFYLECGYYWSSSLYTDEPNIAWNVEISLSNANRTHFYCRNYGQAVRPVKE